MRTRISISRVVRVATRLIPRSIVNRIKGSLYFGQCPIQMLYPISRCCGIGTIARSSSTVCGALTSCRWQSQTQKDLLWKHYGKESDVVNMVCPTPLADRHCERDFDLFWVSNIRACKQPGTFVRLAEILPQYNFAMVGGKMTGEVELYRSIEEAAERLPNLQFFGAVSHDRIEEFFARAKVFVNTSDIEGFPQHFLRILGEWGAGCLLLRSRRHSRKIFHGQEPEYSG